MTALVGSRSINGVFNGLFPVSFNYKTGEYRDFIGAWIVIYTQVPVLTIVGHPFADVVPHGCLREACSHFQIRRCILRCIGTLVLIKKIVMKYRAWISIILIVYGLVWLAIGPVITGRSACLEYMLCNFPHMVVSSCRSMVLIYCDSWWMHLSNFGYTYCGGLCQMKNWEGGTFAVGCYCFTVFNPPTFANWAVGAYFVIELEYGMIY